jgi:uncharacterized protein YecE (DUF72 family)
MQTSGGTIRIGIGGWTYEPWRGTFYPDKWPIKRELEYAAGKMTSIEVNGTYYSAQKPETFAKWHDETPDNFVFALKAPRYATNRRALSDAGESIERFFASGLHELNDKLGPINWQFMPTKKFDPADFEGFLKLLPKTLKGRRLRHALEVRHESFQCAEFVALARAYQVAIIISADSDYPQIADLTAPFVYVRAMGTQEGAALGYKPKALDQWAARAGLWAKGGGPKDLNYVTAQHDGTPRDVYLYVISGHKVLNPAAAQALIARLD